MRKSQLPESWRYKAVDELISIRKGRKIANAHDSLHDNCYPIINIENLRGFSATLFSDDKRGVFCQKQDVLIVWDGANSGIVGTGFEGFVGSTIAKLEINDVSELDNRYFFYFLKSKFDYLNNRTSGATIPHLDRNSLVSLLVPLPPLEQQKIIVSILEKAERTIQKRKEAVVLTDKYLQSVFIDMFGHPATNPMGWGLKKLGNVCSVIYRYPTFYGLTYVDSGTPVVRIGNILKSGIVDPELKNYVFIDQSVSSNYPRTILELNDIVMAVRGDGSTAKRIGYVNSNNLIGANISPNLLRFKANNKVINPRYMFHLLTSQEGQNILDKYVKRTAKKNITAGDIKGIEIPIPPIEFQDKFAQIVEKVETFKQKQIKSIEELYTLFSSLMQKAFREDLTKNEDDIVYMSKFSLAGFKKTYKISNRVRRNRL